VEKNANSMTLSVTLCKGIKFGGNLFSKFEANIFG